ncbi:nuclear transport factor 2 family protein [Allosphingosinicella deserti]|uniref:Ketosteroid isomerase n=1 Tax=Allosphingosinicella deserti TaxID=2116704 RepID=A0A2P7QEU4_9SPHN|nr:nuclear transport factor 2 family protein [Sphingomonas deserti]PSJ36498.1 ketosteroid isomerase [Sphingomonas deserti]
MTSTFCRSFAVRASVAFAATSLGFLALSSGAYAQTPSGNKTIVQRSFDAWTAGTGSPFQLLADEASWTIEGNSVVSKTYPTKEAFLREVIRPFNARMSVGIKPTIKSITADGDRVVIHFEAAGTARDGKPYVNTYAWFFQMKSGSVTRASAFFDAIAFNDLWARVAPDD